MNQNEVIMQARIAWLQMIQAVITRMSNYGFMLKGWGVTLVAALLALSVGSDAKPGLALMGLFPVFVFWVLDGWFLQTETRFRHLYDWAAAQPDPTEHNFAINPRHSAVGTVDGVAQFMFSVTLVPFWGGLAFVCLVVWMLVA